MMHVMDPSNTMVSRQALQYSLLPKKQTNVIFNCVCFGECGMGINYSGYLDKLKNTFLSGCHCPLHKLRKGFADVSIKLYINSRSSHCF